MEKEGIYLHQGKCGGQVIAAGNGAKPLLAVKMLGENKLVGGTKIDIVDAMRVGMGASLVQQPCRHQQRRAALAGFNEHFTQRGLAGADIFQPHGAHHFSLVAGHPKPAVAGLLKSPNILQIGLVGGIDSDAEFLLLDRQNDPPIIQFEIICHPQARQLTLLAPLSSGAVGRKRFGAT